jgi:hypothetical protein
LTLSTPPLCILIRIMTKKPQHKESTFEHLHHIEENVVHKVETYQKTALDRFPFIFLGLSTFGAVMIFYGFEKIIDRIPLLNDKPIIMLIIGFVILILTGALYRKL